MYCQVRDDPTKAIPSIYEEVRKKFSTDMTKDEKITFFQTLPTFRQIQANLYRTRRELIPANPHSQSDLNISSEWFLFDRKSGESFVKGDRQMSDGRRILVFSSDESLKILARARTILGDGTFRVTPSLW